MNLPWTKNLTSFELKDVTYRITKKNKATQISTEHDVALAMLHVYDAYNESDNKIVSSYHFKLASNRAIAQEKETFLVGGKTYTIHLMKVYLQSLMKLVLNMQKFRISSSTPLISRYSCLLILKRPFVRQLLIASRNSILLTKMAKRSTIQLFVSIIPSILRKKHLLN